jgi:hypothetical protein
MKTIEECLDHILQTLIENEGEIFHYMYKDESESFKKLYSPLLDIDGGEFMELLDILERKKYIRYAEYSMPVIGDYPAKSRFFSKEDEDVSIQITLKGKFFRLQGGYQGELNTKNAEKNRIKKKTIKYVS